MPQYGRGVEQMAAQLLTIADREARTRAARRVVGVMGTIVGKEGLERYAKSLWDHLAYLCNYQLDIDFPYEVTRLGDEASHPAAIPYPKDEVRQRQYGRLVEAQLREAAQMPEGQERDELLLLTANRMKQSLADWNRDAMDDHRVCVDIRRMTEDALSLPEGTQLARADFTPLVTNTGKKRRRKRY